MVLKMNADTSNRFSTLMEYLDKRIEWHNPLERQYVCDLIMSIVWAAEKSINTQDYRVLEDGMDTGLTISLSDDVLKDLTQLNPKRTFELVPNNGS